MKENLSRMWRSGLSLVLALCMIFSFLPLNALAAETGTTSSVRDVNGDGIINYVAFGDSVTNGYGMEGYRYEDGTNVFGFKREVETAYPAMVQGYLEGIGAGSVELEQLAISSFRMDELDAMINDDYVADDYHTRVFGNWNRSVVRKWLAKEPDVVRAKYGDYGTDDDIIAHADDIISNEYRGAIKAADLITIDLGTNNFGTFLTNKLTDLLGMTNKNYEMDFTQFMDADTYASLDAVMDGMVATLVGGEDSDAFPLAEAIAETLLYGYLGFTTHYDAAIEKIYEMNPDAQIVVVDVYNMMSGVALTGETFGDDIDLAQLYGVFVDLANLYTRELSPFAGKVTHASLDSDPELFFDYYADYPDANYPDNQYLHPSAERLMNEFIMEAMDYDPDEPEDREKFQTEVLDSIELLDGYVNNIQATVDENVISQIDSQIDETVGEVVDLVDLTITAIDMINTAVEGTATAEEMLPTAIEGVATAKEAVDAAIEGVEQAQALVDMVVEQVVGNSMFTTDENMKSMIIQVIKQELQKMDLSEYGFDVNDEDTLNLLAEEIYYVACLYVNEQNREGGSTESANKLAVIEVMRFILVNMEGYTEEDAQETAQLAYELNAINEAEGYDAAVKAAMAHKVGEANAEAAFAMDKAYQDALTNGAEEAEAEKAGVLAGIAASLTEENMAALAEFGITDRTEAAELVYDVAKLYNATYEATEGDEAAKTQAATVQCLVTMGTKLGVDINKETATTGYQLYAGVYVPAIEAGSTEDEAKAMTVVKAIETEYPEPEGLAEAIYAVYKDEADAEQEKLAYITLMVSAAGIDETTATAIYMCHAGGLDGKYDNEYVQTTMIFLMMQAMEMDQATAEDNYDSYLTYKRMPDTLSKIAKNKTIYIDYLLSGDIDLDAVAQGFMDGSLVLEEPVRGEDESDEEYAARVEKFRSDSSLATLYMRFMSQDGVFIHPSEAGQVTLTDAVKGVLSSIKTPAEDAIDITGKTVLTIGDSVASGSSLEDGEKTYTELVAELLNTTGTNLSVDGLRINEVRALLDSSYSGDAYTAEAMDAETKSALSAQLQSAIQANDVIVVNLGAMNMGFVAAELNKYTTENGATYPMTFGNIGSMQKRNLGANLDGLLAMVQDNIGEGVSDVGTLLLAFESYGYGYTTFTDCFDATIAAIRSLNSDATIVLVGQYDLLGDAYYSDGSIYFEIGDFVQKATDLMNGYMEYYADMAANCIYVDVTGTETYLDQIQASGALNLAGTTGDTSNIAVAFAKAHPTADGHASMAEKIVNALGGSAEHTHSYTSVVTAPTCTEDGYTTYTCSCGDTYTADAVEALGHSWDEGTGSETCVTYTCTVCGETKEEVITVETEVTRVSGNSRYETSFAIAEQLKDVLGVKKFDTIIVASGESYPDALSGSYLSTVKNAPILLTNKSMNSTVLAYIQENLSQNGMVYILGGVNSVTQSFEDSLDEAGIKNKRLAGDNRMETNLAILEEAGVNGGKILISTAYNYADTLSASASGLPILLLDTNANKLTDAQKAFLEENSGCELYIVGGVNTVSEKLAAEIEEYGEVERISGDTREETSIKVASFIENPECVVLAYSRNYPDGLCGGVLAYNLKAPVILINAGVEQLATEYVEENGISKGVVLGGVNSVKDSSVRTIFDMDSEDIIEEVTYVIEK